MYVKARFSRKISFKFYQLYKISVIFNDEGTHEIVYFSIIAFII